MTIEEKTNQLIKDGAAINVWPKGFGFTGLEVLLAAVRWETGPRRLVWCAVYPEDQHHVHHTEYDHVEVTHDMYVSLYAADGVMVAGIYPIAESSLDLGDATNTLAKWRAALATGINQKEFDSFFAEN